MDAKTVKGSSSSKRTTRQTSDRSSEHASASESSGGETHQIAGDDVAALTTAQGVAIADDQNSLTAGERGPTLLEDHLMREKTCSPKRASAFGPRPFALDTDLNQRWLDTHLYTRQDHAERDLEALGHLTRSNRDDD